MPTPMTPEQRQRLKDFGYQSHEVVTRLWQAGLLKPQEVRPEPLFLWAPWWAKQA